VTAAPHTLLVLGTGDDVAIAVRDLAPGPQLTSDGRTVELTGPVRLGHKVALRDLAPGEHVVRHGMPIGSTTTSVGCGDWVHTHNLASDYLVTFPHRGGRR
jgi:hypothetical protein